MTDSVEQFIQNVLKLDYTITPADEYCDGNAFWSQYVAPLPDDQNPNPVMRYFKCVFTSQTGKGNFAVYDSRDNMEEAPSTEDFLNTVFKSIIFSVDERAKEVAQPYMEDLFKSLSHSVLRILDAEQFDAFVRFMTERGS